MKDNFFYKYNIIRLANNYIGEMYKLLPEKKIGNYSIIHKKLNKKDLQYEYDRVRLSFNFKDYLKSPEGIYTFLFEEDEIWMNDMRNEIITNLHFLYEAKGDILILGLGLGTIPLILLDINKKYNNISSITVIEKQEEVISLLKPLELKRHIEVINADVFKYNPYKIFDVIYSDIHADLTDETDKQDNILEEKYTKYLKPKGKFLKWKQRINL